MSTVYLAALSGGVDSSVVLKMLLDETDKVIGITHYHWPDSKCCSSTCMDISSQLCREAGIKYLPIDLKESFKDQIVEPFVNSYLNGFTPNPCVFCNQNIRFDSLIKSAKESLGLSDSDNIKIATGHYARILKENGLFKLKRGLDKKKDQTYMLYRLSQKQLSLCHFPLGEYTKPQVRKIARDLHLATAKKRDSQDICFVVNNYREFLSEYTGTQMPKGPFISTNGETLGFHTGISNYSRGQRKGLGLSGGPWYVINIISATNTIILGRKEDLMADNFFISNCVWHLSEVPENFSCTVQVRYHGTQYTAQVTKENHHLYRVKLESFSADVCPGQSAVFYTEDTVIGGGIIQPLGDTT